jgi:RHS repeat-associated protein
LGVRTQKFNGLVGVGFDGTSAFVYIADTKNERIRSLDSSATVVTLTGSVQGFADGSASQALFAEPAGVAVDAAGKIIVADTTNSLIREVDPTLVASGSPNAVFTLAGTGMRGLTNGAGNVAAFFAPAGVAVTPSSAIIVADTGNQVLRQILVPPIVDSLSPAEGILGSTMTIIGERFDGASLANNTVNFTGAGGTQVAATVTAATQTQITVTVPTAAVTGPVSVTTAGGTGTSATNFEIALPPVITGFSPASGSVGTPVVITGQNFISLTNGTTVTFVGSGSAIPALITSLTATSISVLVPNGAMTGLITVTTFASAQSATPFMVSPGPNDYDLTVTPGTSTVVLGTSTNYMVYLTSGVTTFSELATLSVGNLPTEVTATFTPQQITAGASSTLNVTTSGASIGAGSYSFTITSSAMLNGAPVSHNTSATLVVQSPGRTTLSGRVLSTEDQPLLGVTVSLDGQTSTTDAAGGFLLSGINAGTNRPLVIDGRTASAANQTYPLITEPVNVVGGQANQVTCTGQPNPGQQCNFYLPAIDTQYEVTLHLDTTGAVMTNTAVSNPRIPGVTMMIPAGAHLKNLDGTPVQSVSITPVPFDRPPAPLPTTLPAQMLFTAQPGGATSDVPIPVTYPNLGGADPGTTKVPLYYFDHDTVQWVQYGWGDVSANGQLVVPETNPSTGQPYGLPNFSWDFPSQPKTGDPNAATGCSAGIKNRTRNPVDLSTGNKIEYATDISWGGAKGGLELTRVYTSNLAGNGSNCPFGQGWNDNYSVRLTGTFGANGAGRVVMPDEVTGRLFSYSGTDSAGSFLFTTTASINQLGDVLAQLPGGAGFEYRYKHGGKMVFNPARMLSAIVDRNGNTTTLNYTGSNLTLITDAVGRSITLMYDGSNRVIQAEDSMQPVQRKWVYQYGQTGQLSMVTDALGDTMRYVYTNVGGTAGAEGLGEIFDYLGNPVKELHYDSTSGRLLDEYFPPELTSGQAESYVYTTSGTLVSSTTLTDQMGRTTVTRFDAHGYPISQTDPLGQVTTIQRDLLTGLPLSVTGPCGCTQVINTYDGNGNVLTSTDELGNTESYLYDPVFNNVTQYTDKLGNVTTYKYDQFGNLLNVYRPLNATTTMTYDGFGQLLTSTDPVGNTTAFQYDPYGSLLTKTDMLNDVTTLTHDMIGRLTLSTDPLGRQTAFAYNALFMTSMTDTAGATTTYAHDANGNTTTITDQLGDQTTLVYDVRNRLTSSTDPQGDVTNYGYNLDNEVLTKVSPLGRTVSYTYDARGEPLTVTDPMGATVSFTYDNAGDLVQLTDQRGFATSFTYDELYRPSSRIDPDGATSTATYDANSNITRAVDRLGRPVTATYDALNRAANMQYADASVGYAYDLASKLTQISDSVSGAINWTYDAANRVTAETTSAGTVGYTYNFAGQRLTMTAGSRSPVNYSYDTAGRLQTIAQDSDTFTFSYDTLSRRSGLARPNGVNTSYSYDSASRLIEELHGVGQAQPVEDLKFSYDADNEIIAIGSIASAQQLPAAQTVGTADPANRIPQFGSAAFMFDAQGQTTSKTDSTGTTNYTWDARGRLTNVGLPSGQAVSYAYDPAGRRTSRTAGGVTTNFLYDGRNIVLDSGSDGTVTGYLNGPLLDEKLRQAQDGGSPMYFASNQTLSTAALLDPIGNILEQDQYEAFGQNNAASLTRYQFTGRESDDATGLLYYRARWYDPKQGRFLTEDPAGFKGGLDLYSYVLDNPINSADPLGFGPLCVLSYAVREAGRWGLAGGAAGAVVGLAGLVTGPGEIIIEPGAVLAGGSFGAGLGFLVGTYEGAVECRKDKPCDAAPPAEQAPTVPPPPIVEPLEDKPRPKKGCVFIGAVYNGGAWKTCIYKCYNWGSLVTFPGDVTKPCPGIRGDGLVDLP